MSEITKAYSAVVFHVDTKDEFEYLRFGPGAWYIWDAGSLFHVHDSEELEKQFMHFATK